MSPSSLRIQKSVGIYLNQVTWMYCEDDEEIVPHLAIFLQYLSFLQPPWSAEHNWEPVV